jgi:hypothetical protein
MVDHGILRGEGHPSTETGCPPPPRNAWVIWGQMMWGLLRSGDPLRSRGGRPKGKGGRSGTLRLPGPSRRARMDRLAR